MNDDVLVNVNLTHLSFQSQASLPLVVVVVVVLVLLGVISMPFRRTILHLPHLRGLLLKNHRHNHSQILHRTVNVLFLRACGCCG